MDRAVAGGLIFVFLIFLLPVLLVWQPDLESNRPKDTGTEPLMPGEIRKASNQDVRITSMKWVKVPADFETANLERNTNWAGERLLDNNSRLNVTVKNTGEQSLDQYGAETVDPGESFTVSFVNAGPGDELFVDYRGGEENNLKFEAPEFRKSPGGISYTEGFVRVPVPCDSDGDQGEQEYHTMVDVDLESSTGIETKLEGSGSIDNSEFSLSAEVISAKSETEHVPSRGEFTVQVALDTACKNVDMGVRRANLSMDLEYADGAYTDVRVPLEIGFGDIFYDY